MLANTALDLPCTSPSPQVANKHFRGSLEEPLKAAGAPLNPQLADQRKQTTPGTILLQHLHVQHLH